MILCPKCHRRFDGDKTTEQVKTALKGSAQVVGNIGWRVGGKILGGFASGIHPTLGTMIRRASGQGANNIMGKISDAKFVAEFKCPYCGAKFK